MYVEKTKALISFEVTAKLISVFVFAYAKRWFSHDAAHLFLIYQGHMFIKIVAKHLIMCIINFLKISSILVPDIIKFLFKSSVVKPIFWMISNLKLFI